MISIVIPLYNEKGNVRNLVGEVIEAMSSRPDYELILVNDGSNDDTWTRIDELATEFPHIRGIDLAGNYGQTIALRAGFDAARGDVIIAMDGDMQHDPRYLPKFIDCIEQGYDMVGGFKEKRPDGWFQGLLANFAHRLIAGISGVDMKYFGATFKAYRSYLLEDCNLLGDNHRFLAAIVARKGIRYKEFPMEIRERKHGESNYRFSKILPVIIDLLLLKFVLSYMNKPFRLFGAFGIIVFLTGFVFTAVLSLNSLFFGAHIKEDYLAEFLLAIAGMTIGMLFISFGLIAEIGVHNYYARGGQVPYRIRGSTRHDR
jgi:glycosyltransferase involved in cell wall biosynthesis